MYFCLLRPSTVFLIWTLHKQELKLLTSTFQFSKERINKHHKHQKILRVKAELMIRQQKLLKHTKISLKAIVLNQQIIFKTTLYLITVVLE